MDNAALYKVGYGLYVLTAKECDKDNGCIINTVLQVTNSPPLVGVITVSKQNHTHDMIVRTKQFNLSVLTTDTPFEIFRRFGFQSGATTDKFVDFADVKRSENGILYLSKHTNAFLSFAVTDTMDFGSHTMFKADIIGGEVLSVEESMTYTWYRQHIKPKPPTASKSGFRCIICGYVFEGEVLPENFICPLCKHGASDFVWFTNAKEVGAM